MSQNGPVEPVVVVNPDQMQLIHDDALRKMDHVEWLRMLAGTLEHAPERRGIPMTPFRAGAIERIRFVVKYIELLHREARDDKRMIAALEADLKYMKGAPEESR